MGKDKEIEITDKMISAGIHELLGYAPDHDSSREEYAVRIFTSMAEEAGLSIKNIEKLTKKYNW